jgi:hypothetical protein
VVVVVVDFAPLLVEGLDVFETANPPTNGFGPCRCDTKRKATPTVMRTMARAKISGPRLE